MEDDLKILENGRRPQYFGKWETTSICWQMEDNLNVLEMEDNLKWKLTSIFCPMENDLNILAN